MKPSIITRLRDFVPIRPLSREEALRIAELQTHRFLELSGIGSPPVPERAIAELPRLQVERLTPLPVSGATHWTQGRWLILLNGAEPVTRQRFSLAHEFKHVLDHRFIDVLYSHVPAGSRHAWTEQVCDFFAGCLLMPRPWVKRAYTTGVQRLPVLAARFGVSQIAMKVRLDQIGLSGPSRRCDYTSSWLQRIRRTGSSGNPRLYERTPKPVLGPVAEGASA